MTHESDQYREASDMRGGLAPPRFGLKTMFLMVAAVAASLAFWLAVGPGPGIAVLLIGLVVFAHVAGNALGSQLRDGGARIRRTGPQKTVRSGDYAPVTKLSQRAPLGRCLLVATVIGGVAGAIGGGTLLFRLHPESATVSSLGVGCLATGALGSFWAFWVFSLLQVFLGAWWQAHRHDHRPKHR